MKKKPKEGAMRATIARWFVVFFCAGILMTLSACDKKGPTGPSLSLVTISPTSATLVPGQSQEFQASGGDGNYTWTATGGSLNRSDGSVVIFTAGSTSGNFTVTASSSGVSASARIEIPQPSRIISLTVRVEDGSSTGTPLPDPVRMNTWLIAFMKMNIPTNRMVWRSMKAICEDKLIGEGPGNNSPLETQLSAGETSSTLTFRTGEGSCRVEGVIRDAVGSDRQVTSYRAVP